AISSAAQHAPRLARQFLALHRAKRRLGEQLKALDDAVALDERAAASAMLPYEEVRDYFHYRDNYVDALDRAAEALAAEIGVKAEADLEPLFERALEVGFNVRIQRTLANAGSLMRRFDPDARVLAIDPTLGRPTRIFQLAHQLALLAFKELIEAALEEGRFRSTAARDVCRVGLGNYAAGALALPYRHFAETALAERH